MLMGILAWMLGSLVGVWFGWHAGTRHVSEILRGDAPRQSLGAWLFQGVLAALLAWQVRDGLPGLIMLPSAVGHSPSYVMAFAALVAVTGCLLCLSLTAWARECPVLVEAEGRFRSRTAHLPG